MTRLPHESWNVEGVKLPKQTVTVGPMCANPGCGRWADHAHHIWRRSFIGGDYSWVKLWDGEIVANLTGLCFSCHQDITENRAQIIYTDTTYGGMQFVWVDAHGEITQPIVPQPPRQSARSSDNEGFGGATQLTTDGREVAHAHVVGEGQEAVCPTCKRRKNTAKKSDLPPGEKRKRARFVISVPKDEEEDGFEVLDTLFTACAEIVGRESQPPYYTLVETLAFFIQHSHLLTREEVA